MPWDEALDAGRLLGLKFILNEVVAYLQQASLPADALSARTDLMMLYALCGFANFSSVGITIAGVTVLAPNRRKEIVQLAQRSLIFWDTLRQRGNQFVAHQKAGLPPVLHFEYETVLDARSFDKPVNYALVRIIPPKGVKVDGTWEVQAAHERIDTVEAIADQTRPVIVIVRVSYL